MDCIIYFSIGIDFDFDPPDCFERDKEIDIDRDVPVWGYIHNDNNCELTHQSSYLMFNTQFGIAYKVLKSHHE